MGFKFIRITGHSMMPRIPDNSYVLIHTWLKIFKPKPGNTLLIKHHKYGHIIKTLSHIDKQGFYWVKGESMQSVSMSNIGPIIKEQILGKVCITLSANH
ncbi:nickel-type superoxide dismutase maturation protease [Pseudoalteromonas denitrificans]|jgi:nickel-type superoxide dismutase maturation protease|uniref:Nickel-type superoxide dismutase maturation protease n=1 Tax=Pseudoalteromonas denitrificans DSM 6059 TaxID=1123010 RepID=A0A1I1I627_9GAMM|nr:nickel-type superoxide dismutase maturation protease [Pseudoalteromonas denitrificans]SFC28670.1 nickel-type superoxide dismutase maturation protease [Pseudoalteromonas denitrificans DSM 6059]